MPLFLLSHRLNEDHYILKYNSNPFTAVTSLLDIRERNITSIGRQS
nr:MAG TPA: hypothetical protein [Caudoviricetes sp.]